MEGSSTANMAELTEDELLAEGRRAMVCKEYYKATNAFEEACAMISGKYGQMSKEMGEPSYLYGKALLELARMENALFGGNAPISQQEEEEEEGEESDDEDIEQEPASHTSLEPASHTSLEPASHTSLEPASHTSLEPASHTSLEPVEGAGSSSSGVMESEEQKDDKGEEEPTTLQLAWEMFEVARVIYETSETLEEKLRLADINLLLGEVSLESDEFNRAIDDFTACLKIRELVVKPEDRLLAEVHFQLGLANTFAMNSEDAITEYEAAKQVIKLRKEILQAKLDKNTDGDCTAIKKELIELEEILPDIDSKINDVYEIRKNTMKALEEASHTDDTTSINEITTTVNESTGCSSQFSETKSQVNDISHLMRKKPKRNENHDPNKNDDTNTITSTVIDDDKTTSTSRKRPISETSEDGCSTKRTQMDKKHTSCFTTEQ